jgi:hypothetical protein
VVSFYNPEQLPKSTDFISILPANSVKKLKHCGWEIDKTLFLEVSYCVGSAAGSALIKNYENEVYYTACIITKRVVKDLKFGELKVLVNHEQWEVDELLREANEKSWSAFIPHHIEERRHEPEMEGLYDLHGKDFALEAISKTNKIAMKKPFIDRQIGLYWYCLYVLKNYERLKDYAFNMTDTMLSENQKKGFIELLDRVDKMYGDNLPTDEISPFFHVREKLQSKSE